MSNFERLIHWHRARPNLAVGIHTFICLGLLGFALYSQYVEGYAPCVLCIWQRWPYIIITIISLLALTQKPKIGVMAIMFISFVYLINATFAFFHMGVQAEWWAGTGGCGFNSDGQTSVAELYEQIKSAPLVSCADISWRFLGLSMPFWNMVICLGLAGFSFCQAWVQRVWLIDNSQPSTK